MDVGYIGLGDQGAPIARLIAGDPGLALHLWARRPESLEPFRGLARSVASSPRQLGSRCDIVAVCVTDAASVRAVTSGQDGLFAGMRPGSVLIVNSTISPADCGQLAAVAASGGIGVVDAPVSRVTHGAERFTCLVGGRAEDVRTVMPVLRAVSDRVSHLGPLGAGQRAKVVNNVLLLANMRLALESYEIAASLGLDREAFQEVLQHCSGHSFASRSVLALQQGWADVPGLMAKELGILRAQLGDEQWERYDMTRVAEALLQQMLTRPWDWVPNLYAAPADPNPSESTGAGLSRPAPVGQRR